MSVSLAADTQMSELAVSYQISEAQLKAVAFMLGTMALIVLSFRIIAPKVFAVFAPQVSPSKIGKCSVYLVELVFTTLALGILVAAGAWDPKWLLGFVDSPTLGVPNSVTLGELAAAWICASMYAVELAGEPHMRPSLLLHHFGFMARVFCALLEIAFMPEVFASAGARMVALWLWPALTEQNVFLAMLVYRLKPDIHPIVLKASAIFYIVTRVIGAALAWFAFCAYAFCVISHIVHNGNALLAGSCLTVQLASLCVMMWAQWSSCASQLGLARKQAIVKTGGKAQAVPEQQEQQVDQQHSDGVSSASSESSSEQV